MSKVEELINELINGMAIEYMRTGISINMEPDAFYRFHNELQRKDKLSPIPPAIYEQTKITINTSFGPVVIYKDDTLGKSGYVRVYTNGQ